MPELLTVPEIARLCHVHEATIRRHIRAGKLRSVHIGRSVRVRREDFESYLGPEGEDDIVLKPFTLADPLFELGGAFETAPGYEWISTDKHRALAEIYMEEFTAAP